MKRTALALIVGLAAFGGQAAEEMETPLGLPPLSIPADNPQTEVKARLGDKLFHDERFSQTGDVSCSTCHEREKAFTDSPLEVSEGINGLKGTRNAPTVINAAFFEHQFWDGREPSLERQSTQPFVNPVEMGLPDHNPILDVVREDSEYRKLFQEAFGVEADEITLDEVSKAIAAFERTVISGNSPFDRWRYGGEEDAMSEAAKRGFEVFLDEGRCVSCHTVAQTHALFTDNKFHNLNVGFPQINDKIAELTEAFRASQRTADEVDIAVLSDGNLSELGRFAVSASFTDMGAFKTPTLRNVELTAPYMHDGSLATLEDVVEFYDKGGKVEDSDPLNDFQSGGIQPLDLTEQQKADLVAFMEALTSPEIAAQTQTDQTQTDQTQTEE